MKRYAKFIRVQNSLKTFAVAEIQTMMSKFGFGCRFKYGLKINEIHNIALKLMTGEV